MAVKNHAPILMGKFLFFVDFVFKKVDFMTGSERAICCRLSFVNIFDIDTTVIYRNRFLIGFPFANIFDERFQVILRRFTKLIIMHVF